MLPFPEQSSAVAGRVDTIFTVLLGLGCFFSGVVALLIIIFAVYYRKGHAVNRENAPVSNLFLELVWSLIPLVIGLAVFAWAASIFLSDTRPPPDALEIYVVGKQWMWQTQQPGGQREINALHIPVNTPINLIMISEDVIHSLWIPDFRIKQDLLPGRYTQMWFTATQIGEYPLNCAEYCGTSHADMIGTVYVVTQSEYQTWLSGKGAAQSLPQQGEQLFQTMGCSACHRADNTGRGPSLVGLFGSRVQLGTGAVVTADETYIRRSIVNPGDELVAGYSNIMPTYKNQLNEDELVALLQHIRSLQE